MAYTDRLLSFDFIERRLNVDAGALRVYRVNRTGHREAWLTDVVSQTRPDARRLANWLSRVEAAELIRAG
jgi:hypothetical protein